jgi:hypothetical protein
VSKPSMDCVQNELKGQNSRAGSSGQPLPDACRKAHHKRVAVQSTGEQ